MCRVLMHFRRSRKFKSIAMHVRASAAHMHRSYNNRSTDKVRKENNNLTDYFILYTRFSTQCCFIQCSRAV